MKRINLFFILLLIFVTTGCSVLGMPESKTDTLINILDNKKEKIIFLVGNKYTYIFPKEDDSLKTRYLDSYDTMSQVLSLIKRANSFKFLHKPNMYIEKYNLLNGGATYDMVKFAFSIRFYPTIEQIKYLNNIRPGFRNKNADRFALRSKDKYNSSTVIKYAKTRCFLDNCSDNHEEYILDFSLRYIHPSIIETTKEMKNLKSKLRKTIGVNLLLASHKAMTKEEIEKSNEKYKKQEKRQKEARRLSKIRDDKFLVVAISTVMIPVLILASPIALYHSIKKEIK